MLAVLLSASLAASTAWAAPVPSQTSAGSVGQVDDKAVAAERELIKGRLLDFGLAETDAASRVDLLTDQEVHALAGDLDSVQAAGATWNQTWLYIGAAVVIYLILR